MNFATFAAPPLTNHQRDLAAETYEDVRGIIRHAANTFLTKYGGDRDSIHADANAYFVGAYCKWDQAAAKMSFQQYVFYAVFYGLFDARRKDARRNAKTPIAAIEDPETLVDAAGPDRLTTLLETVSDDAKAALTLVLCMPQEIAQAAAAKGGSPRNIKSTLRSYLLQIGWSASRVADCFAEIKGAL